ncbi:MAG TPA: peptidylprolyl isomerase, partial [Acidobacteriaceae bacterium]|nr:peptidylprolyl isomerase [Acidobacteriaceae bacterium]
MAKLHMSRLRPLLPGIILVALAAWAPHLLVFSQQSPGPSVDLQIIVVRSAEQAGQILARLHQGEDFATLAREVSIDPNASAGGYVSDVDPRTLRPELRSELASMKPGDLSSVIPAAAAFVILKLLSARGVLTASPANPSSPGMGPNRRASGRLGIQYPADVAGQVLADLLFEKFPKPV